MVGQLWGTQVPQAYLVWESWRVAISLITLRTSFCRRQGEVQPDGRVPNAQPSQTEEAERRRASEGVGVPDRHAHISERGAAHASRKEAAASSSQRPSERRGSHGSASHLERGRKGKMEVVRYGRGAYALGGKDDLPLGRGADERPFSLRENREEGLGREAQLNAEVDNFFAGMFL